MKDQNNLSRFARVVLPVLAMVTVGYAGTTLLLQSHAAELPTGSTAQGTQVFTPPPVTPMPTTASSPCCELTITSAKQTVNGDKHVSLTLQVKNTSTDTVLLSPGLQTYLTDTSGGAYNYTAAYQPAGATIGGPLKPGAVTTMNLDFVMPPSLLPQALSFQQDGSSKQALVGLPAWTQ